MNKICPVCNSQNAPDELFCSRCMADISAVKPGNSLNNDKGSMSPTEPTTPELLLVFEENRLSMKNGDILGRSSKGTEILAQFPGVSREHAEFKYEDGKWFVIDRGSSNGTFLNGEKLTRLKPFEIKSGDRLGVSRKVEFEIRLKSELSEN